MGNKINKTILCLILLCSILLSFPGGIATASEVPKIENTKAFVLMDQTTGKVLLESSKDTVLGQASVTKLMTYYIIRDYIKEKKIPLTKEVKVDADFSPVPNDGSRINLKAGDTITIGELIDSLLIVSANDSAIQLEKMLEDDTKGSFLDIMNAKARSIGLNKTSYINTSGLTEGEKDKEKYNTTTAYEIALLSKKIIDDYPDTLKITSKKEFKYKNNTYPNTNKIMLASNTVDGLKTGFTDKAGYCISSTEPVKKGNDKASAFRLIAVTLGSKSEDVRTKVNSDLLKYGRENFENKKLVNKDEVINLVSDYHKDGKIPTKAKDDTYILLQKDIEIKKKPELIGDLKQNIKKGDVVGRLTIKVGDSTIEEDLIATENVNKVNIFKRIGLFFRDLF